MNYFITSIAFYEGKVKCTRTFGYFHKISQAKKAVAENRCNMVEALYNYLVIERIHEGIHAVTNPEEDETWYYAEENTWVPCRKPNFSIGTVNWALG